MKLPLEGRWLGLAGLLAVLFAGALLVAVRFVRLPTPQKEAAAGPQAGRIGIATTEGLAAGASLKERSLLNPAPLFLPTEYNASQPRLPLSFRREPGASFDPVPARYAYAETAASIRFPDAFEVPDRPEEALIFGRSQNPYESMANFARVETPLPAREAIVEVVQTHDGRMVLSVPVTLADPPPQMATADWSPLELMAAVDATGLIGAPVLTRGSGVEAVDGFLRIYLSTKFNLGERVAPGFYAVRIGP
jgi:hypothetical protein